MTTAMPNSLRDPQQVVDGIVDLTRRFNEDFGIAVTYATMPDHETGDLDGDNRVITLRRGAPLDDLSKALGDYWYYLSAGPHAAPHVRPQPTLRLVPHPRDGY